MTTTDPTSPPADTEPDYRFTLANERTFLAWIRTALGLLAGGVAVHELARSSRIEVAHVLLGTACVVLAVTVALGAFWNWRKVQSAMRCGLPLPHTILVPLLSAGVTVIGILAVTSTLTR